MNYRHEFHAGNFADVVKHAVLARAWTLLAGTSPVPALVTQALDAAWAEATEQDEAETALRERAEGSEAVLPALPEVAS